MVLKPLTNFPLRSTENTHSPKQATKCKVYFYQLFHKVLNWTLEMRLWQPWENVFAGKPMFPFDDRTLSYKYFCFRKFFLKMFICTCRLRFWEPCLIVFLKVQVFSTQSPKLFEENKVSRLISPILFSPQADRWFDTPDQRNLQQRQINHSNSKNDNRKKNFFGRQIIFPQDISLEARIPVVKNLKTIFWLKVFFFISKSEEVCNHVQFKKKTVFPQKFLKVRRLQFRRPCR